MNLNNNTADRRRFLLIGVVMVVLGIAAFLFWRHTQTPHTEQTSGAPAVTVSKPITRKLNARSDFLGQFSAIESVDLRAQVGGILTDIHFVDGQIVHKGDLLFVIDTRPYQIRLDQAAASLLSDQARLKLATTELARARQLKEAGSGSVQNLEQRSAEYDGAEAAVQAGTQAVNDAKLDLEYCHMTAPFTGRMSRHLVNRGNLISGSRTSTAGSTLLSTIVSVNPIYLDFDMSESDFLAYARMHKDGNVTGDISFLLSDETHEVRQGKLDFIDNAVDRSSGTIHARATVQNADLFLVPGEFAHLSLTTGTVADTLLVPEASIATDQTQHVVLTVAADGTVVPKTVTLGPSYDNLRVVTHGLTPDDRVIIDGLMHAVPGGKVKPEDGTIAASPVTAAN